MNECTFKPYVSPNSTKIAYHLLDEIHLGDKEFRNTYTTRRDSIENKETKLTIKNKNRLFGRINKFIAEYNVERKEKQDISTE